MPDWYTSPPLALAIILVIIGFWILIKGADYLVEGGVVIARRFQLSLAVIGATIVAFGTSLPELVVSVGSSVKAVNSGQGGVADGPAAIAIANIVGSNIFNIGAILGISALICRLEVSPSTKRLDYPLMLGVFVLFIVFCLPYGDTGFVNRIEGGILVAGLLLFTFLAIKGGKVDADEIPETDGDNMPKAVGFIILGIVMLMLGGDASLNGAISLAESLGMSNRLIGLTVMAIGTSLPELVTSIQAARKGHAEMAIANVVGSNLFNVLSIIGISALILPLPVAESVLTWDFYWMMGFAIVLLPFFFRGKGLGRPSGTFLCIMLVVFVTATLLLDEPAADVAQTSATLVEP